MIMSNEEPEEMRKGKVTNHNSIIIEMTHNGLYRANCKVLTLNCRVLPFNVKHYNYFLHQPCVLVEILLVDP